MLDGLIRYLNGELLIDGVAASAVVRKAGSPVFAYSAGTLRQRVAQFRSAFAALNPRICYAVKASGNIHLLRLLAQSGCWMDVVSGGELERTFIAGVPTQAVVFAGVGKQAHEIRAALSGRHSLLWDALDAAGRARARERGPVHALNVESEQELDLIAQEASRLRVPVRCHLRVNPDVDARTHRYITTGTHQNKFGVPIDDAQRIFAAWKNNQWIDLCGLHTHIGSMIARPAPYIRCVRQVLKAVEGIERAGMPIRTLDLGGGFGVDYGDTPAAEIATHAAALTPLLRPRVEAGMQIALEPGRWIVAGAGVLLVKVLYTKQTSGTRFAVVDAGMNALIRPALYEAFHIVWPTTVKRAHHEPRAKAMRGLVRQSVVGPICESGDFLALDRDLPPLSPGDIVAVFGAGAYGMSMASTYNDQPKPAEVLVDGKRVRIIRRRDEIEDLLTCEMGL